MLTNNPTVEYENKNTAKKHKVNNRAKIKESTTDIPVCKKVYGRASRESRNPAWLLGIIINYNKYNYVDE